MKKYYITQICCALFTLLFLYAGISKLQEHNVFRIQLAKHSLLTNYASGLSWGLPVLEIAIGILLTIPRTQLLGVKLFLALMGLFTVYMVYMLIFYDHLPCSCGGVISQLGWHQHLLLNISFMLLAALVLAINKPIKEYRPQGF